MMLQHWVLTFLDILADPLFIVVIIAGYMGDFDAFAFTKIMRASIVS